MNNKVIENIYNFVDICDFEKIFLDFDGVLTHSVEAIVEILNERKCTNYKPQDVLSWNFKEIDSTLTDEEMEDLFLCDEFFDKVKFIDGVIDFMKRYQDKIIIVTKARPKNFIGKVKLMEKIGLSSIPIIPIPLDVSKDIIDMSDGLFIDDSTYNLKYNMNARCRIQFREFNDDNNEQREWIKDWNGLVMYHW